MINDSLQVDDPSNFGVPISSTNKIIENESELS